MVGELLEFPGGVQGMALNLEEDNVGAVLLGEQTGIREGDIVKRTGKIVQIPSAKRWSGVSSTRWASPSTAKGRLRRKSSACWRPTAPGVVDRQPVKEPLQTGIKAIDSMIPIGRGQRELIIGDRGTGKTAVALWTRSSTSATPMSYCIYVAIGQKASTVANVIRALEQNGAMEYTTVVAATADDPASQQYISPYTGVLYRRVVPRQRQARPGRLRRPV